MSEGYGHLCLREEYGHLCLREEYFSFNRSPMSEGGVL